MALSRLMAPMERFSFCAIAAALTPDLSIARN